MKAAALVPLPPRRLTAAAYQDLAEVPHVTLWFANLGNAGTQRAYKLALTGFMRFTGIERPEEFRTVTGAHVVAWRDELAAQGLSPPTIRNRLSALASLFDFLCEKHAVTHNPVNGIKRPAADNNEGKTPAIGDHQARKLLAAESTWCSHSLRNPRAARIRPAPRRGAISSNANSGNRNLSMSPLSASCSVLSRHPQRTVDLS